MLRKALVSLSLMMLTAGSAAYAQTNASGMMDTAGSGVQGYQSNQAWDSEKSYTTPENPGTEGQEMSAGWADVGAHANGNGTQWGNRGQTQQTKVGAWDPGSGSNQGPNLSTQYPFNAYPPSVQAAGGSGAATGAPIPGTFIAPGNIALMTQYKTNKLPPTVLDSFVANSAKVWNPFLIYGDEGTFGPPPLDNFSWGGDGYPIQFGINGNPEYFGQGAGLTTLGPGDIQGAGQHINDLPALNITLPN